MDENKQQMMMNTLFSSYVVLHVCYQNDLRNRIKMHKRLIS